MIGEKEIPKYCAPQARQIRISSSPFIPLSPLSFSVFICGMGERVRLS